jgi:sec-independent protein translocase protein TatB
MDARMPSFQDSAVIFILALLLFGPKKLPELARQLGKLMGEFRRASNEFRMQMEDELRASEQAEKQKQIAAIEAAAPVTPAISAGEHNTIAVPTTEAEAQHIADSIEDPLDSHPHMQPPYVQPPDGPNGSATTPPAPLPAPVPIATSGDLSLMPPATGLPVARSAPLPETSALTPVFDAIPQAFDPDASSRAGHPANNGHPASNGHPVNSSLTPDEAVTHG